MARGRRLSDEERALIVAQTEQARGETATQQQRLALAAQELAVRQAGQISEAAATRAKTAKEQEMTPSEKLLTLARAGEPEAVERMGKVKSLIDLMQLREAHKQHAATIEENRRTHEATVKAGRRSDLVKFATDRPDVFSLSTLAETLRKGGDTDLADTLDVAHKADVEKRVAGLIPTLPALQKSGKLNEQIAALDPDVQVALKPHIDATQKEVAPPIPLAQHLGGLTRLSGLAALGPAAIGAYGPTKVLAPAVSAMVNSNFWKDYYRGLTQ